MIYRHASIKESAFFVLLCCAVLLTSSTNLGCLIHWLTVLYGCVRFFIFLKENEALSLENTPHVNCLLCSFPTRCVWWHTLFWCLQWPADVLASICRGSSAARGCPILSAKDLQVAHRVWCWQHDARRKGSYCWEYCKNVAGWPRPRVPAHLWKYVCFCCVPFDFVLCCGGLGCWRGAKRFGGCLLKGFFQCNLLFFCDFHGWESFIFTHLQPSVKQISQESQDSSVTEGARRRRRQLKLINQTDN